MGRKPFLKRFLPGITYVCKTNVFLDPEFHVYDAHILCPAD